MGFLGAWINTETKLTNSLAVRSEFGFDYGWRSYGNSYLYVLAPGIRLEPRWYYNFQNRVDKSRQIEGNSGNYIALRTSFHPDLFVISNTNNVSVNNQLSIVPIWGIRRCFGKHFNYEAGIGIGYRYIFPVNKYVAGTSETLLDLNLRIGYRF